MTTTKPKKPALERAQSRSAKNRSKTRELSQTGRKYVKQALEQQKQTYLDSTLPALATQAAYPELFRELEQMQGANLSNWTEFGPGLSQSNAIRLLTGKPVPVHVYTAFCQASSILSLSPCDPDEMAAPDPEPHLKQLHRANQRRIKAIAQGKSCEQSLLNCDWAKGSTVTVSADTLFLTPSSDFHVPYTVHVPYRKMQHQVGVVVATPTGALQPLVDGRLYLWTGALVKNGKKEIQTLRFKGDGDVDARIQELLSSQVPLELAG